MKFLFQEFYEICLRCYISSSVVQYVQVFKLLHLSNNSFRSNRFNLGSRNHTVWKTRQKNANNLGKTHKSILLQEMFFARFSQTPTPPRLETFQSKIDNQFKLCAFADVDDA